MTTPTRESQLRALIKEKIERWNEYRRTSGFGMRERSIVESFLVHLGDIQRAADKELAALTAGVPPAEPHECCWHVKAVCCRCLSIHDVSVDENHRWESAGVPLESSQEQIKRIADVVEERGLKHASGRPLFFTRYALESAITDALSSRPSPQTPEPQK